MNTRVWRMKWKIQQKMLVFCLLLLIVPSLSVGISSYISAKKATDDLIQRNLENSVKLMKVDVSELNEMVELGQLSLGQAQENLKELMLGAKQGDGTRPGNPDINLGDNGYFYVISDTGDLIAHPSLEGQNLWEKKTSDGFYYIQDLIKKGQNGGGFTFYKWPLPDSEKEALKLTYALKVPEWNWIIVAGSYYQDYSAGQSQILKNTLITLLVCFLVGSAGVYLLGSHIARPIKQIAEETRKVSSGDLTSETLMIRNTDEIGSLAHDFNSMKEQLKALVEQVAYSSGNVTMASGTLKTSIEETAKASHNIAESVQEIAAGMDMQAQSTEQSSRAMEEMAAGIVRVADTSARAYEASVRSEEEALQGYGLIGQSIDKMHVVKQTLGQVEQAMHHLNEQSGEISTIAAVMTEIASQTTLLSLNASIEAARAGEQGKGFAVVAAEVKKLAERSKISAEQIGELVKQVQTDIAAAAGWTARGIGEFQQGVDVIEQTGAVFAHIREAAQDVVGHIQEASAAAEEMSASSQQLSASLQELDRIASHSAESSELISAAAEEQISTMTKISKASGSLQDMAFGLKEMLNKFRI